MRWELPQEVIGGKRAPVKSVAMVSTWLTRGQRFVETTASSGQLKGRQGGELLYCVGRGAESTTRAHIITRCLTSDRSLCQWKVPFSYCCNRKPQQFAPDVDLLKSFHINQPMDRKRKYSNLSVEMDLTAVRKGRTIPWNDYFSCFLPHLDD